ncbi:MAG: hypothetical protein R2771_07680 [Saprospiraceae bacterium]
MGWSKDNSFGTNEFLNMCELLETEPYLSANVGSGSPQEFSDWIKLSITQQDLAQWQI